jgi:hypothetical protein
MESITLTTPQTFVSITDWHIIRIDMNRREQKFFLEAQSNTGLVAEYLESGDAAMTTMKALNKADLSVKSLERRALEYLQAKGVIGAGSVTGTPD